ncbi:MAG TPA: BON domain-containing protein [Usitatibacter sp.]|nr:BON domain-containing protein [Usitatibacter sp.]
MTTRTIPAFVASAALAALAVPAFAAQTITIDTAPTTTYYVTTDDDYVPPTTYYYYEPAATQTYSEPPIVVTEPRATEDELITQDVVDTLASDPRLSGRIGVETTDREVELSGIVTSWGQALRAERDARSVPGVSNVHNTLATRIGGGRY